MSPSLCNKIELTSYIFYFSWPLNQPTNQLLRSNLPTAYITCDQATLSINHLCCVSTWPRCIKLVLFMPNSYRGDIYLLCKLFSHRKFIIFSRRKMVNWHASGGSVWWVVVVTLSAATADTSTASVARWLWVCMRSAVLYTDLHWRLCNIWQQLEGQPKIMILRVLVTGSLASPDLAGNERYFYQFALDR